MGRFSCVHPVEERDRIRLYRQNSDANTFHKYKCFAFRIIPLHGEALPFSHLNCNWKVWIDDGMGNFATLSSLSYLSATFQLTEWQRFILCNTKQSKVWVLFTIKFILNQRQAQAIYQSVQDEMVYQKASLFKIFYSIFFNNFKKWQSIVEFIFFPTY